MVARVPRDSSQNKCGNFESNYRVTIVKTVGAKTSRSLSTPHSFPSSPPSTSTYSFHSFNHRSFLDTMAARPGYAQPDPRYPFPNPPMPQPYPQQYQQRRRDYDAESDFSDPYGSRNTSTTHLTGNPPYYDHAGQHDHSEYPSSALVSSQPDCPSWFPYAIIFACSILLIFLLHRGPGLFLLKIPLTSQPVLDRTYVLS